MQDWEIDSVYDYFEFLITRKKFIIIDKILENIDAPNSEVDELLTYLTATLIIKSKLANRKDFYNRVAEIVDKNLLEGLT